MTDTDLYVRLSDLRIEEALDGRVRKLQTEADRLGWRVPADGVIIENDLTPDGNGNGQARPASAFKRKRIRTPSGKLELRTVRPGFRRVLDDICNRGRNLLAEDLDRACRDPRDLEDLIDACEQNRASARSLSGSLTLTEGGTDAEITMARMMVAVGNKESRDKARRVSAARERLKGQSYGGGRRPFGFTPDPDAPKFHKRLLVVEAEAQVIREAARDVLERGISLKAVAMDLRDRRVPTVTGARWSAEILKDILLNDSVRGLTDEAGNEVWPAIISAETQDRIRDLLASDSREVTGRDGKMYRIARAPEAHGNAARWLLSGIATCGVCGGPVKCTGTSNRRAYTCTDHGHVRRAAVHCDELVAARVIALLERDASHLLRPKPTVTADTAGLRAEERKLKRKRDDLARLLAEEILTEQGVRIERKRIDARLAQIAVELASSDQSDPLPEFRDPDADILAVWDRLGIPRQRAVVKLLYTVTILPVRRMGNQFDPESVQIERRKAA